MLNNEIFSLTYYLLYGTLAIGVILFYSTRIRLKNYINEPNATYITPTHLASIVVFFALMLLVGMRAFDVGTDTGNYFKAWQFKKLDIQFQSDFLFYFLMAMVRQSIDSYQVFLIVISALYYYFSYKALKNFSVTFDVKIIFLTFVFFSLFFYLSSSINIMRQGFSLSLFMYGVSITLKPKFKLLSVLSLFFISALLHLTSLIPILLFGAVSLFKNISIHLYIVLYLISAILSYFGVGLIDVSFLFESFLLEIGDKRLNYLDVKDMGYKTGFRLDFLIFNSLFLLYFLALRKRVNNIHYYDTLLKYFCIASAVFFMAFQINYSDRVGLFSWFIIAPLFSPAFASRDNKFYTYLGFTLLLIVNYIFIGT